MPVPALTASNGTGVRNRAITIQDVIAVMAYVGTSAADPNTLNSNGARYGSDLNANGIPDGQEYDRTAGAQPWAPGPPNGSVTMADVMLEQNSVGDNCT